MPVVQHAVRAAVKARPEHHVGKPVANRLQQPIVILRVVLQVGVLDEDNVAARESEAGAERGTLALVVIVEQHADVADIESPFARRLSSARTVAHRSALGAFVRGGARRLGVGSEKLQELPRAIGGAVVDEHHLLRDRRRLHPTQELLDRCALVVDWDHLTAQPDILSHGPDQAPVRWPGLALESSCRRPPGALVGHGPAGAMRIAYGPRASTARPGFADTGAKVLRDRSNATCASQVITGTFF